MERSILLFEPDFPCWDEETFALAGEAPSSIRELCGNGFLVPAEAGYVLSEKGEKFRQEQAKENYISALPIPKFDPLLSLWNNRLYLLMEHAFIGQFGIKEYSLNEALPVVPQLSEREILTIEDGKVKYIWNSSSLIKDFISEFPNSGVGSRHLTPPGENALNMWMEKNGAKRSYVCPNLLLRSRYDFELYRKTKVCDSDKYKMKDADRLFFFHVTEESIEDFYINLGKLHIFLLGQKRVYIPGYADIDSHDQENWTMAVAVADTESSLEKIASIISVQGKATIDPMPPLFIIGTSIERLREQEKPEDTVYDWFCDRTIHIARPDI